jgi:hypothetical protein
MDRKIDLIEFPEDAEFLLTYREKSCKREDIILWWLKFLRILKRDQEQKKT